VCLCDDGLRSDLAIAFRDLLGDAVPGHTSL
jgi:hypothetical protein